MPLDYTAWPLVADVQTLLDACAIELRLASGAVTTAYIQRKLDSVVAEVDRRTKRQWIAGEEGETRVYDGSGTPEMIVDEMVELEGATVLYADGDEAAAVDTVELQDDRFGAKTRIVSRYGSVFPEGRLNIQVTGTFGYAASIPEDLWDAVAQEAAYRIASEVGYRPIGRVAEQKIGDATTKYRDDKPWMTGWRENYKNALQRHRRRGPLRSSRIAMRMV